ncbi:PAS domain S-box protein [Mucilaginibacter aquaedulcis]|uniref:PAS domain S-box protein n=1 Tax=Mucilaginibacter aquaedulcis TaxID=1187081 RepID=UPI0025B5926D|nr:PAS domain S-box protein [Mucilaginibacter aquaedulcis]MDN3550725.1 PAS domain S-box protein [Mucilaginibacter aquaedulcis]
MFNHTSAVLNDCVLAYDLTEQRYLFISPEVYTILGLSPQQLYHDNNLWETLIKPNELAEVKEALKNLYINQPLELTYTINTPQQTTKKILDKKRFYIDAATGHSVMLSIITDEVPANNKTTAAETFNQPANVSDDSGFGKQFLNLLIDSKTSFLIRIDVNGNYSFINGQYTKIFGYKPEDLLGKHFSVTTVPEEVHLCEDAFIKCINNPGKIISLLHKKPDIYGNLHDTEWEFISVVNKYGTVCEIQGIGQDVTNRLKTERQLLQQNKRINDMASLSSHELRRPVASMLGLINIMDKENLHNPENKQIMDYLQIVSTEIDEVIRTIVDNAFTGNNS